MAVSLPRARAPISEINTTPLIDVLLVLLIMIILAIPIKQHSLDVPLPQIGPLPPHVETNPLRNKIVVTTDDAILWNGDAVSQGELLALLVQTRRLRDKPELLFEPDANASYEASVKVINAITDAGVTKFGFVGNHRYREFGR